MYQLYYSSGACSMAAHVVLNSVDAAFTLHKVDLAAGQQKAPDFLKLNSRGQVPVLVDDGFTLREGAAILVYLCEKHQSAWLPREGQARAAALEWLMFGNATLHPAYSRVFALARHNIDQTAKNALFEIYIDGINALWQDVEARLERAAFLAGDDMTIGDILLAVIANWGATFPKPVVIGPRTKQLLKKVIALPPYQKALAVEQVAYQAAA